MIEAALVQMESGLLKHYTNVRATVLAKHAIIIEIHLHRNNCHMLEKKGRLKKISNKKKELSTQVYYNTESQKKKVLLRSVQCMV